MNRRELCKSLIAGSAAMAVAQVGGARAQGVASVPKPRGKIFMPLGDATEAMDTLYAYFRLQEEGYEVVVSGPDARLYNMVLHEVPPGSAVPWDITEETPGYHIKSVIAFRDVKPEEYAGMFVSGGRAPEYLRYNEDLMRAVRHFFEAGKPVAVVCHGVEIVAAAGVLKGRKMTTVAKCALDITSFGGEYIPEPVVVDGNLISCRTWHDYGTSYMKEFIAQLNRQ